MKTPALWIALNRPDNLVLALAAAGIGRQRFTPCHLIYEDSPWWHRTRWETYRGLFDSITVVAKIRALRGLLDARRYHRELSGRQRQLKALGIGPADVIFTLAGITALSNGLASAYPQVAKVFGMTIKKYHDASRPADFLRYRHTTSSWLQNHWLEPRAGVGRTLHLKPWRRARGDGVRLERLQATLEMVFEKILILSNTGDELPPGAGPRLSAAPFPNLTELEAILPPGGDETYARRRVIFFGTPFLLVRNLPPERYAERLDACLDYLRRHYGDRCQLVYRPHPAEKGESERLRLDGFTYEDDQEVAELYFLKHARNIEAVYSVSSTVSRVAFNYGLNAYALWRCFPFSGTAATYFQTLMDAVPPEFDLRSLDDPPVAYAGRRRTAGGKTFTEALTQTLDDVEK